MSSEVRAVQFASAGDPTLQLEGRLHLPGGSIPFPAAVVAHPHPVWGGTMDTPVLVRIAQALVERGLAALRFNFRGVGGSQGRYGEGCGETDDLIGAFTWLAAQDKVNAARLAVVGYSFGAWIGARVVTRDERIQAYAAVALPMGEPYHVDLSRFNYPKFFIVGARDTVSPPELLRQYVGGLTDPKTLRVIRGMDHFLLGFEQVVADRVADFLLSFL